MKKPKTIRYGNVMLLVFLLLIFFFVTPVSTYAVNNNTKIKFKPEYKIKRIPNEGVRIYSVNTQSANEGILFRDFNADVVLLIYRRYEVNQITSSLAKKYFISEDDSRRGVKRVINALQEWGLVTE